MNNAFRIENGNLIGARGSWRLASITGVYQKEGGPSTIRKWLTGAIGFLIISSLALRGESWILVIISMLPLAYMGYGIKSVVIIIEGKEIEIFGLPYWHVWYLTQAEEGCNDLIALVSKHLK